MKEIMTIDDAVQALSQARAPADLVRLSNVADAMRHFARRSGLGLAAQNRFAEIRLKAELLRGDLDARAHCRAWNATRR